MKRLFIIILALILTSGGIQAQPQPRTPTFSPDDGLSDRAAVTGDELAAAMDIPAAQIIQASLGKSDPKGAAVFSAAFGDFPTKNTSFAVLSTGKAKDAPTPNTVENLSYILDGLNTSQDEDLVQLTLKLTVPANATFWAVDFKFLSEEFKEFIGSPYNDAFFIETPESTFIINTDSSVVAPNNVAFDPAGNPVTINSTGPTGMSRANAAGTTYDGATGILTAYAPIPGGTSEIKLIFSVLDISDSVYDTAVFLDNFRFLFGDVGPGNSNPPVFDVPPTDPSGTVYEVEIGEPLSISLQATDPDAGDTVTIDLLETVTGGNISSSPANPGTGTFTWTPTAGQEGVYVLPFIAKDNNGAASTPHNLVVTVGNIAPEAVDDEYSGTANLPIDDFAPGVLENDTDINNDPLTVNTTPVQQPSAGTVDLAADGGFEYTPNTDFSGVDVFAYEVSDGEFTDTAKVYVKVGSNLLSNGGFETQGFNKIEASSWKLKNSTADQRSCDKPIKDKLFAFTGAADSSSSIQQKALVFGSGSPTKAYLTAWVKTESLAAAGTIKVVVKHTGATKDKFTVNVPSGSADYTLISGQVDLTGTPASVKVKIGIGKGTGKFTIDDVFVTVGSGSSTLDMLPLPDAEQ